MAAPSASPSAAASAPSEAAEARARGLRLALCFALATFALRYLVALSRSDETELELYTGSFGWALVQGLPLDLEHLPIIAHLRGSVLFGGLCAPIYWLFGPRLLALKFLPCLWSAAQTGCLVALCERRLGRTAALVAGAAMLCATPNLQMVSVLALGSHESVALFVLGALLALPRAGQPLRFLGALKLGACCGAGLLFSLQAAPALPAVLLAWWALDARFWRRAASLGWLAGCAPLVAAIPLLTTENKLVNKTFGAHFSFEPAAAAAKVGDALAHALRRAWLFEEHGGAWLSWIVLACLLVGLAFTLRAALRREALALYALAHPLGWLAAYAVSDFEFNFQNTLDGIGSRYALPIWPALCLWLAIGARELVQSPWIPLGWLLGLAPAAAGAVGCAALIAPAIAWQQPPMRGTDFTGFGLHLKQAAGSDLALREQWLERIEPDWAETHALAYQLDEIDGPLVLERAQEQLVELEALPQQLRPWRLVALGGYLGRAKNAQGLEWPALASLPPSERAWVLRGAGRALALRVGDLYLRGELTPNWLAEAVQLVPAELRAPICQGMGFFAGQRASPYNPGPLVICARAAELPPKLRAEFFRAAGWGFRTRFFESDYRAPEPGVLRIEALLPATGLEAFRAGLSDPKRGYLAAAGG